jgi:Flp pilus assembly protein TadG
MHVTARRGLWRDRRGAVAIILALAALPLFGAVGIAVDGVRAWLLASRLQAALDAGVLAGARNINLDAATRDAEMRGMFWTNFKMRAPGGAPNELPSAWTWVPFMRSTLDPPQPRIRLVRERVLEMSATARIPTTFASVFGIVAGNPAAYATMSVTLVAEAERIDNGLELALVLDVTGSMGSNRTPSAFGSVNSNGTNIDALRLAAGDLVNILYGDRDTIPNLFVSVTPYTTTVNLGSANTDWLAADSRDFKRYAQRGWQGCVEARFENGNDQNEATAFVAPFRPYFAASTIGMYSLGDGRAVAGDNDWLPSLTGVNGISEQFQDVRENNNVGPNRGCPALPVLPLTASKATVLDRISRIRSTFRGGTMHNIGLQAGWFTLSPDWRGIWPGVPADLPRAYREPYREKVLVLMTDGETAWYDWPGGAPGECSDTGTNTRSDPAGSPPLRPTGCSANFPAGVRLAPGAPPIANNADYTGFGRPLDYRLGFFPGVAQMVTEINRRVSSLCETIKSRGITVYTITFNVVNTAVQDRFRACATRRENYFNSPTQADLRAAFRQIGSQLATLRLTR